MVAQDFTYRCSGCFILGLELTELWRLIYALAQPHAVNNEHETNQERDNVKPCARKAALLVNKAGIARAAVASNMLLAFRVQPKTR